MDTHILILYQLLSNVWNINYIIRTGIYSNVRAICSIPLWHKGCCVARIGYCFRLHTQHKQKTPNITAKATMIVIMLIYREERKTLAIPIVINCGHCERIIGAYNQLYCVRFYSACCVLKVALILCFVFFFVCQTRARSVLSI